MYHFLLPGAVCQMKFYHHLLKYFIINYKSNILYLLLKKWTLYSNPDSLSFFLLLYDMHVCGELIYLFNT